MYMRTAHAKDGVHLRTAQSAFSKIQGLLIVYAKIAQSDNARFFNMPYEHAQSTKFLATRRNLYLLEVSMGT